jgi:oleandomycin transport system permease protein
VKANPVTSIIDAARGLMLGGSVAEPLTDAIIWMAVLLAIFVPLAIVRYRRRI